MPEPQTLKNHARMDPQFHYFLVPLSLINIILSIYITIRDWPIHSRSHLWWIVMSVVLLMTIGLIRGYANKNQDRIIRLEERIRYVALLPTATLDLANELTLRQIIALRFASDAELPGLIKRAIAENLPAKAIKQNIINWRADNTRV